MVDVAVEQQGIASAELAEPPLPRLAPPRVFDPGVHVGVKAIPGVTSELEEVWAAGLGAALHQLDQGTTGRCGMNEGYQVSTRA